MTTACLCLLLFVLNLAVAFGAGVYEARIVLPLWFVRQPCGRYVVDAAAMRQMDVGRRFWGMVTTLPLTVLTLVNLYYAFVTGTAAQAWWIAGAFVILAERVATFTFFIPVAVALVAEDGRAETKKEPLAKRWMQMNYVRNGITGVGMLLCLKALLAAAVL